MSNSTGETLENENENERADKICNANQRTEPSQEWETMARAWVSAFPDAKAVVSSSEVETWIGSNLDSLPADLRHMPRSELVDRLLSIQHYMRPTPSHQNEQQHAEADQHPARFQRTDQWLPVYSWLESLDHGELVKSKDISEWLDANPEVKQELSSRHSRYHLTHYVKKCHLKILKRKEKKSNRYGSPQRIHDLKNIDIVFHIGDITYANGYISQWDQFTAQVEPIASTVPYMIASGNHERDWPDSGSFYGGKDSGGECGVPAETMFYFPAENKAKFWYSADYGMFRFCVADTEHDWREGSEQFRFIERCLASVDRKTQPWLIFIAHRVLGYSTNDWYGQEGSFEEPMGRESLQKLWQKYKVDIAFYGHVHNYERTCPIYQNQCVDNEKSHFSGAFKGTIHVVVGGAGSHLSSFSSLKPKWSIFRDYDYGFVKLTAFDHSSLLFEYKKSSDGAVHDSFTVFREYRDVLACVRDSCDPTTLAS